MQNTREVAAVNVFVPHAYQQYCIDKILDLPSVGLYIGMGMGKTVITLTALQALKYDRFDMHKALVIAPKKVAEATWSAEAAKWEHLTNLKVQTVLGARAQREKALMQSADVYVIGRDNTQWLVGHYGARWPFDVVVLDESSSFKNPQAKRFRALKAVRGRINRMIELTGTPAPRDLMDLWAQLFLLDGGKRLGRTLSVYRDNWFVPDKRSQTVIYSYRPTAHAAEEIYAAISDICISLKSEDYLDLPELMYQDIPVELDPKARADYDRLERDAVLQVLSEAGEDSSTITANTAATLANKLLQLCNGAVYDEYGQPQTVHSCKLDAFVETIESLQGEHALVFYAFQHDKARILQALADKMPHLRVRLYSGPEDQEAWNAGEIDILLAHPQSCCYGLNLQQGGRHVVWFGLTWSLEQYQQANKRLHRQGQPLPVMVHHLVVTHSVDVDVMKSLQAKDRNQDALLEALKARIEKATGG